MSTKVQSNFMVRHNKIPFNVLANDEELHSHSKNSRDAPRLKNVVDRLVGNLRKQRRYLPVPDHDFKHHRLTASASVEGEQNFTGTTQKSSQIDEITDRSSSLEKIGGLGHNEYFDFKAPSDVYMGRRRSRSDSDLLASCEIFARRRAAICEEMERNLLMENGVTLRKCRKNLVLNQILENLSLL
jgi:predicted metal-dependent phosphoesterase TrpH